MARAYGVHGLVPWDYINFAPGGRPNLQAPLMYWAIGGLGRLIGGTGSDYVLANSILAAVQWGAAMATAAAFALCVGGEWTMLFAAALLSGAAFASASFAVGIPSGWLFILTPWGIHFFMRRRLALDPADKLSASSKVYILPLGPNDHCLESMEKRGWVRCWGGTANSGVVTLAGRAPFAEAAAAVGEIVARQAAWLSQHAVNNTLNASAGIAAFSQTALDARRMKLIEQRERMGRIELALVMYANALEPGYPGRAARMRRAGRAFGVIAGYLGDEFALDFENDAATRRLKRRLGRLAAVAQSLARDGRPNDAFMHETEETVDGYLVTRGTTFEVRPPGNKLPWLRAFE
jgi:hypothetical protein